MLVKKSLRYRLNKKRNKKIIFEKNKAQNKINKYKLKNIKYKKRLKNST